MHEVILAVVDDPLGERRAIGIVAAGKCAVVRDGEIRGVRVGTCMTELRVKGGALLHGRKGGKRREGGVRRWVQTAAMGAGILVRRMHGRDKRHAQNSLRLALL